MSEVQRFWCDEARNVFCVRASDYDTLTAQRDEGLAREAEAQRTIELYVKGEASLREENEALQQRLAEAEETLAKAIYRQWYAAPGYVPWVERGNSTMQDKARDEARHQLAIPGCADREEQP